MNSEIKLLKVSTKSKPNAVAGAIAGMIRNNSRVQIQTIGAGALNQAIKGIAIARGFIAPTGHEISCIPFFKDIEVNGEVELLLFFPSSQSDIFYPLIINNLFHLFYFTIFLWR